MKQTRLAVIGAGNIGVAIAKGLSHSGQFSATSITLTRRKVQLLEQWREKGFCIEPDNCTAVGQADILIIAVEPRQMEALLVEIAPALIPDRHTLISVVSGVTIDQIRAQIGEKIAVVRVMPNTAIAVGESMTCITTDGQNRDALDMATTIFDTVGKTLIIDEEQMTGATALAACGVAFFLRAIRAASQGGIEIGFHSEDAYFISAQTARGAASLLLSTEKHPEHEIDRVTTPRGCTIAGLNQMEHAGFSSAMIKGITTSAKKAGTLLND
jgi:pyrroline-5-carboxylate reductase